MTLPDESVKLGLKEEEIMYMLFREDMQNLQGNAFDGSKEEMKIFQGVFCNNVEDPLSGSENPAESSGTIQCRIVESLGDGYLCCYSIHCTLPCSRTVSRENTGKLLVPTKITSEIEPDVANQTKEAELKSNPISIATALPFSQIEPDTEYKADQREVANEDSTIPVTTPQDKRTGPQFAEIKSDTMIQSDQRKPVPQGQISTVPLPPLPNTTISPRIKNEVMDQTSLREAAPQGMGGIVHELLPTTPPPPQADQRDEPGSRRCSSTLGLENPSLKDLCTHLRAHANRLLAECGYKMKLRRRKGNSERFDHLYQQPYGGPVISHLPKTWVNLGKMLQSSLPRLALDKTHLLGRQWLDVNEFTSDLLKTLTYVEKMLQAPDCGLTLSDQWFLLDPFMAVAWIDHKIGALKKAIPIKAVQSTTSVLAENEKIILQRNDATNPLTYSRRCKKYLTPLLALDAEQEKKMDGANILMVGGGQVVSSEGVMSGIKDIISPNVAEEGIVSASVLRKGPCTTGGDMHNATKLLAVPVTIEEKITCAADFQVTPGKLRKIVPITTGEEVQGTSQLHASPVTNGEEALHTADISVTLAELGEGLRVNPVTIGEGPSKKHSCENPGTPPDNIPVRWVNQTFQSSTIQSSISSTLEEVPFSTVCPVARYDNIPVGTTFTINRVAESMVPQRPVLVLYPSDVPFPCDIIYTHSQSMTSEVDPSIHQASLFQGMLSFGAEGGLQIPEHPITWAMCKPLQSKLKRKHKCTSDTKENKPRKRLKENKEKSGSDTKKKPHKRKGVGKRVCRFHEHDLLISAIIMKKSLQYRKYPRKPPKKMPILSKHSTDQTIQLGETNIDNKKHFTQGARTVLKLLNNTGMVSVNSKIQFRDSKGNKVKEGKLTKDGVLCLCCGETFTMSGFQIHSSHESGNPGLNLFLGSGKPYVMCLFKAWSVEYKDRRQQMRIRDGDLDSNNDMCALCGDGGELVCCDSCPSSFHELCLPSQIIPEDCWHCPSCRCGACEQMIGKSLVFSSTNNYLQCSQCDRRFHEKCIKDKNVISSESLPGSWFCGNQCQQVYNYMRSQVGLANYIGDGFYFRMLKCDHGQTKILNLHKLVQLAELNMKLALALRITEECFFPVLDPRTGLNLIPLLMYNWRVNILSLDCKGFYTVVLEKDERIISVASIRLRGAMVAEMPLVATSPENREQGMCRRLVSAIEEMLKSLKVKMLVLCAIPSLVDTWVSHFGFVPIEDGDKEMLSKLSLLYIPGTYILKKDLSALSVEPQRHDCQHASAGNEFSGAEGGRRNISNG